MYLKRLILELSNIIKIKIKTNRTKKVEHPNVPHRMGMLPID
jgi:hypothetical protein